MVTDMLADMAADMEVDKVANKVADMVADKKKEQKSGRLGVGQWWPTWRGTRWPTNIAKITIKI